MMVFLSARCRLGTELLVIGAPVYLQDLVKSFERMLEAELMDRI